MKTKSKFFLILISSIILIMGIDTTVYAHETSVQVTVDTRHEEVECKTKVENDVEKLSDVSTNLTSEFINSYLLTADDVASIGDNGYANIFTVVKAKSYSEKVAQYPVLKQFNDKYDYVMALDISMFKQIYHNGQLLYTDEIAMLAHPVEFRFKLDSFDSTRYDIADYSLKSIHNGALYNESISYNNQAEEFTGKLYRFSDYFLYYTLKEKNSSKPDDPVKPDKPDEPNKSDRPFKKHTHDSSSSSSTDSVSYVVNTTPGATDMDILWIRLKWEGFRSYIMSLANNKSVDSAVTNNSSSGNDDHKKKSDVLTESKDDKSVSKNETQDDKKSPKDTKSGDSSKSDKESKSSVSSDEVNDVTPTPTLSPTPTATPEPTRTSVPSAYDTSTSQSLSEVDTQIDESTEDNHEIQDVNEKQSGFSILSFVLVGVVIVAIIVGCIIFMKKRDSENNNEFSDEG